MTTEHEVDFLVAMVDLVLQYMLDDATIGESVGQAKIIDFLQKANLDVGPRNGFLFLVHLAGKFDVPFKEFTDIMDHYNVVFTALPIPIYDSLNQMFRQPSPPMTSSN